MPLAPGHAGDRLRWIERGVGSALDDARAPRHTSNPPHPLMPTASVNITGVLAELRGASREQILERLVPLIYAELRTLARAHLRNERSGHTLQTADLVHETYLRLAAGQVQDWHGRRHLFSAAAEAMRRILI